MSKYIEEQAIFREMDKVYCEGCRKYTPDKRCEDCDVYQWGEIIIDLPPADVAPVVRGEWVDKERHEHYPSGKPYTARYCGVCGKRDHNEDGDFCGYCGADMRNKTPYTCPKEASHV